MNDLPHSIEAERAVLGAILINPAEALADVSEILNCDSDAFFVEAHKILYSVIIAMEIASKPISVKSLIEGLTDGEQLSKIGGISYISSLADAVSVSSSAQYYAQRVRDLACARKAIIAGQWIANNSSESITDIMTFLDTAEAKLHDARGESFGSDMVRLSDLMDVAESNILRILENKGLSGITTGITSLDAVIGGFQDGKLYVLAGRPGLGKTALAMNMACAVARERDVLFFSLEMGKAELATRVLYSLGGISKKGIIDGGVHPISLKAAIARGKEKAKTLGIWLCCSPGITPMDLRARIRRHEARHKKPGLVVLDYLQLMTYPHEGRENRQVEVSRISGALKTSTLDFNIPILSLSQFNRQADDGEPKLSHLRESGSIEQDADVVMMLAQAENKNTAVGEQAMVLRVGKNRDGGTLDIGLSFFKNTQEFRDAYEKRSQEAPKESQSYCDDNGKFDQWSDEEELI